MHGIIIAYIIIIFDYIVKQSINDLRPHLDASVLHRLTNKPAYCLNILFFEGVV
jgi:hypothetical protein